MENSWYRIALTSPRAGSALQDKFTALFMTNHPPKNAAMFTDLHDGQEVYFYYFSPEAAAMAGLLISSYSGDPCVAPQLKGTALLVGDASAMGLLGGGRSIG